jgi:sulfur relay (sulfurtransferase) DsrC/TusE family protein
MATRVIAGKEVQVNDEGFMTEATEWDKDIAVAIAAEEGIPDLTADHWTVIFALFPKGPAKKVAHIAGLGKPEGCV